MTQKVRVTLSMVVRSSAVTVMHYTCRRLDLAELFGRDTPHPHCGVSEACCDEAGVVCEVHCSQTLQVQKG